MATTQGVPDGSLVLTTREFDEIKFATLYDRDFGHGTDGHNRLLLIAKLAMHLGFAPDPDGTDFIVPKGICIRDNR